MADFRERLGHLVCIQEMDWWLNDHAGRLDDRFARVVAHRMADCWVLAARDWGYGIDEDNRAAHLVDAVTGRSLMFYGDVLRPGATIVIARCWRRCGHRRTKDFCSPA